MTPERASYHRLMLLAGMQEEYELELDRALEVLNPIPEPELSLAFCMSDPSQTVSVLYNYILDHPADAQQVHDMVLATLREQYICGSMSAGAVCEALSKIQRTCEFGDPWIDLYTYLYEYELLDEGMISQEVFEIGFESVFLHGKQIDVWALQKERNQKKKKSLPDFFRKHK